MWSGTLSKALVHFYEVRLKKSDLVEFSNDEIAAFGLLSQIANEISSLSNLLSASHVHEGEIYPVDFAKLTQHNVLLRTLVSRVFEAFEFLVDLVQKNDGFRKEFLDLFARLEGRVERLKKEKGYALNRNLRNETAFHYKFDVAKKNVKSAKVDLDASMFVSKMDGNCYFTFGEQLMFVQRLARFGESDATLKEPEHLIEVLSMWTIKVIKLFKEIHSEVFGIVLDQADRTARKTHYFVEHDLVFDADVGCLPLFVRGSS